MAINAIDIYRQHHGEHHVTWEECKAMFDTAERVRTVEESEALNRRTDPFIVVSASGMLTGGRVLHHIASFGPDAMPGQSDANELIDWMAKVPAPEITYITHGEPDSCDALRFRVDHELEWKVRVPEHLESIDLLLP